MKWDWKWIIVEENKEMKNVFIFGEQDGKLTFVTILGHQYENEFPKRHKIWYTHLLLPLF